MSFLSRESLFGALLLILSVASSVGIVSVNKYLFQYEDFVWATTLTLINFSATWCFAVSQADFSRGEGGLCSPEWLRTESKPGYAAVPLQDLDLEAGEAPPPQPLPPPEKPGGLPSLEWSARAVLAASNVGSIVFMNLSLMHNSVGIYQLSKLVVTPCIAVIQFFHTGQTISRAVAVSLTVITVGAALATRGDVSFSVPGMVIALIAVFLTALSQVYQSHVMKSVPGITVMALIRQSYPIALVLLALVAPAFESVQGFVDYKWTSTALALLGVSCAAAIAVNYAIVAIVGRFSALTYQVTGHLKTVLLFVAGWVIFEEHYHEMTFVGMAVTAVGLVLYTLEQLRPKN